MVCITLSVFVCEFYDSSVLKWAMSIIVYVILYTQNLLKNCTIVKNLHTKTGNVLAIKFHRRSPIHFNF